MAKNDLTPAEKDKLISTAQANQELAERERGKRHLAYQRHLVDTGRREDDAPGAARSRRFWRTPQCSIYLSQRETT